MSSLSSREDSFLAQAHSEYPPPSVSCDVTCSEHSIRQLAGGGVQLKLDSKCRKVGGHTDLNHTSSAYTVNKATNINISRRAGISDNECIIVSTTIHLKLQQTTEIKTTLRKQGNRLFLLKEGST